MTVFCGLKSTHVISSPGLCYKEQLLHAVNWPGPTARVICPCGFMLNIIDNYATLF